MYRIAFLLPCVALPMFAGCGVEEPADPSEVAFETALRALESSDQHLEGAGSECSADAAADLGQEVDVMVCINNVCVLTRGTLEGCKLTIALPRDPALVGLPIHAYVPGVGTFSGTYTL